MNCHKTLFAVLCAATMGAMAAQAGVVIVNTETQTGQAAVQNKTYLDKDRVRIELKGQSADQMFIFRQDKGVFWFVDNSAKTYTEMTKADLDNMLNAVKQMETNLQMIPAEQRAEIMKSMQGQIPFAVPRPTYTKAASGEKAGQWTCDKYEGTLDGKKYEDVWTTDLKKLGLAAEDFTVLQEMGKFFEGFAKNAGNFFKVGSDEWAQGGGYAGVPVKTIMYTDGKAASTREIKEIKRQDLAVALFELPTGYAKKEMH
jgi:hypothetical protein